MANDYSFIEGVTKPDKIQKIKPWTDYTEDNGTDSSQGSKSDAYPDIDADLPLE